MENNHHKSERPEVIELIRSMTRGTITPTQTKKLNKLLEPPPCAKEAFIIKSASGWLETGDHGHNDSMLFGDFWRQGELCILFADTNVGKSILAVQIGEALSRGETIFDFAMEPQPEPVLYFDFELSARQFEARYTSKALGAYGFSPNFYRVVFNPDATGARKFSTFADYINNALENTLITTGAHTIIIDNITCLRSGTDVSAGAVKLMNNLREMKSRYGLSVLVLAHTPKRNPARPVTRNDLQGSKMLINFADSAFAIGESQTVSGLRYLKQIKQRSTHEVYGAPNVCLCRIEKPGNFLMMKFVGNDHEAAHLAHYTDQQRKIMEGRILQLHRQGLSLREIAAETRVAHSYVFRLIKRLGNDEAPGKTAGRAGE